MQNLEKVLKYLGQPYSANNIDHEPVAYRKLENDFELEVSEIIGKGASYSVYVWMNTPHRELMGIYHGIHGMEQLKDVLGYCAFKYGNLQEKIQVEREDMPE